MAEQEWPSPYPPPAPSFGGPSPSAHALRYELRPLSVGEVLDRVFSLYRSHFWLFVGLSSVSAAISAVLSIARLLVLHFSSLNAASPSFLVINSGIAILQGVLYLIAYSFTYAATMSVVNTLYLGEPTSLTSAMEVARKLWLRCLGISLWQAWSAVWLFIAVLVPLLIPTLLGVRSGLLIGFLIFVGFLVGAIYGIIAYLRNSLAVPAAVVEDLHVRAAMRRSKTLATGRIGRIFLLFLLMVALGTVAGLIEVPFAILAVTSKANGQLILQALILGVNFLATSLVGPVGAIGLCLFYFDERVRREGFDIEFLLRSASVTNPAPPPSADVPPFASPEPPVLFEPSPALSEPSPAPEQI